MNPIPRQGNIKNITNFGQKCQQSDTGTTQLRQDKVLPRDARNVLSADRPAFKVIVFAQVCKCWQCGLDDDQDDHLMILYLSVSNNAVMKEMIFDRKLYLR